MEDEMTNIEQKYHELFSWGTSISLKSPTKNKSKKQEVLELAAPELLQEINFKLDFLKLHCQLDFNRLSRLCGWTTNLKEIFHPRRKVAMQKVQLLANTLGLPSARFQDVLTPEEIEKVNLRITEQGLKLQSQSGSHQGR